MSADLSTHHVRDAVRDLLREDHLDHADQCFAQQRWEAGIVHLNDVLVQAQRVINKTRRLASIVNKRYWSPLLQHDDD
jgi:hypothetical protein